MRAVVAGVAALVIAALYLAVTPLPSVQDQHTSAEWIGPVHVVEVETGTVARDQAIRISAGRIAAVVPAARLDAAARARLRNMDGAYVSPGLWDMHAVLTRYAGSLEQPLNLAHGITRVRSILNCPSEDAVSLYACQSDKRLWNRDVRAGRMFGAITMGSGSFPVGGPERRHRDAPGAHAAATPEQARELVRLVARQRNRPDHIKTYDGLPRSAFFAMMSEARLRAVEVSGHVPIAITPIEASDAGLKAIAHTRVLPIACSSSEAEIARLRMAQRPMVEWMRLALDTHDPARCHRLWSTLKRNGTFVSPTLITRFSETKEGLRELVRDPDARTLTPGLIQLLWREDVSAIEVRSPSEEAVFKRYYGAASNLTAAAARAGVRLVVGSDTNDVGVAPGVGFHKEVELWRRAGIPADTVLRSATINAARYFGREGDMGRVAPGFVADLIFTRENPLADVRALRRPHFVMQEGRLYDRVQLNRAIESARGVAHGWRYPAHFIRDFVRNPLGFAA